MLCSQCGKNEAEVFFKQIINNQITQQHLCAECAQSATSQSHHSLLLDMLAALTGIALQGAPPPQQHERLTCRACGLKFGQFVRTGRLGCAACYDSFSVPLKPILRQIHGVETHAPASRPSVPAAPSAPAKTKPVPAAERPTDSLRQRLKEAVAREDFEEAARLRDKLKELGG